MRIAPAHRLVGTVFLTAVAAATLPMSTAGEAAPASAPQIAGTYFIIEHATGTKEFLTLSADGNVFLNSSAEGQFDFGSSQGVWARIGPRSIAMTVANFDFDDSGIAVIDFSIEFDKHFHELRGAFSGGLYPDTVDPLNLGSATPLFTFQDTITGRRMFVR